MVRLPAISAFFYPDCRFVYAGRRTCRRVTEEFRPDVIHVHTIFTVGLFARSIARRLKIPFVGTNHNYIVRGNTDFYKCINAPAIIAKPLAALLLPITYWFYRAVDLTICPSKIFANGMRETGHTGQLLALPNPIDSPNAPELTSDDKNAAKKRIGMGSRVLLHFGRLSFEKSVDVIIKAFGLLHAKYPDLQLFIIGDGPARGSLESLVHSEHLEDSVRFHGYIEHDELMASGLLSLADVYATASATESQGLSVIEAMASGLPVIGVRGGAVPEMIGDGGLVVAANDPPAMAEAIGRILDDPALADDFKLRGQRRAAQFTPAGATEHLITTYQSLVRHTPVPDAQ